MDSTSGGMDRIRRRRFLVTAAAVAAPYEWAQAQAAARIGYLNTASRASSPTPDVFLRALGELGWTDGRNLSVEWRFANGDSERTPRLAAELVDLRVQAIVAAGSTDPTVAQRATRSIPIVALSALEPVKLGLAASLSRPGGNVTGVLYGEPTMAAKSMQLLREMLPGLQRAAYLYPANDRGIDLFTETVTAAAKSLGITMLRFPIARSSDIATALASAKRLGAEVLRMGAVGPVQAAADEILAFSVANRIPTLWSTPFVIERGGFMSFAPLFSEIASLGASVVDQILRGADPAELPFRYSTRYELVINLRTAKDLNITVPRSILARADRLVE